MLFSFSSNFFSFFVPYVQVPGDLQKQETCDVVAKALSDGYVFSLFSPCILLVFSSNDDSAVVTLFRAEVLPVHAAYETVLSANKKLAKQKVPSHPLPPSISPPLFLSSSLFLSLPH